MSNLFSWKRRVILWMRSNADCRCQMSIVTLLCYSRCHVCLSLCLDEHACWWWKINFDVWLCFYVPFKRCVLFSWAVMFCIKGASKTSNRSFKAEIILNFFFFFKEKLSLGCYVAWLINESTSYEVACRWDDVFIYERVRTLLFSHSFVKLDPWPVHWEKFR